MFAPAAAVSAETPAIPAPVAAASDEGISFETVLHSLNPLQYLPVVGTIYRAITGDILNEGVRAMGSMLVGGLLGGPIGVAISAGISLAEHATHIDPDVIAHGMLVSAGMLADTVATPAAEVAPAMENPRGSATAAEARVLPSAGLAAYQQTLYSYGAGLGHA